jgi:PAS domain-containing protein
MHEALRTSMSTGRSLRILGVPAEWGYLDVTLEAMHDESRRLLLIATPSATRMRAAAVTREMREDLASTNDELQSANEELAATNEELQSANEELASLNEEFQSTNQNLATSNAELLADAAHARPAADLIRAIVQSRHQAMVAFDKEFRITLYNQRAGELLGLHDEIVGKPLSLDRVGLSAADIQAWFDQAKREGRIEKRHGLDGSMVDFTIEPIASPHGAPLGWVLSCTLVEHANKR